MERSVEGGQAAAYPECGFSAGGRGVGFGKPRQSIFFAWLPVCVNYNKPVRVSVSLI